jgi:exopolysaccharide production protein ExoQ
MLLRRFPVPPDAALVFVAFTVSNLLALISVFWFLPGIVELEAVAWLALAALCLLSLEEHQLLQTLSRRLVGGWVLLPFVVYAGLSVVWSVAWQVTLSRWISLLCLILVGAFIGIRCSPRQLGMYLAVFGGLVLLVSAFLVLLVPGIGVMNYHSIQGAWKGIYWHKNHLGIFSSFVTVVLLTNAIAAWQGSGRSWLLYGALYLVSLGFVAQTDSVAAYLTLIVLHVLILLAVAHLKLKPRLRGGHYAIMSAVLLLIAVIVLGNLKPLFGVFNRNPSLTGRVPMWGHLMDMYVAKRLLTGYGLNAFWHVESHRTSMQLAAGYPDQIVIADNGFIDVLVGTGLVGLGTFLLFYVTLWGRAIRQAWTATGIWDQFPVFVMAFILLANMSWSMIFENEGFFMLLMTTLLFMLPMPSGTASGQKSSTHT